MTDILTKEQNDSPPETRRATWALVGGVFILNSFVLERLLDDGSTVAQLVALGGVAILLVPMLRIVISELRQGRVRMNELAVLAVLAGASRGDFKTAGVIALIMLLSLIIESRTASGARASLEALTRLTPGKARRVRDGVEEEVSPDALRPGDLIRIRPGENVPADGEIVSGATSLNEASITGESVPADKSAGDTIFFGTTNLTGALEAKVTRAGEDTTLGKVRRLILAAERTRLPMERLMDRYVAFYTPAVLCVALMLWLFTHDAERLVALFVAACPVALFLATPSVMVAALSAAARMGVLIKNVADLEGMANIDAVVFDKTGTLTTGQLGVARLAPSTGVDTAELLAVAGGIEQESNHPLAMAICKLARSANVALLRPSSLHQEPGRGVRARLADADVVVGNWAWLEQNQARKEDFPSFEGERGAGMSLVFVMSDGRALGWIGLEDGTRPEARQCIEALRRRGVVHTALITGDRRDVGEKVAEQLAIPDWRAECVPSDKVDYVHALKDQGERVVFVGDGVNDGPALAASHIGIALGAAGSDVALESASIALMNNNLGRIPFLVDLSRASKRIIIQNYAIGSVIVVGGGALSAMGMLTAVPAAMLQVTGAVAVAFNSARLVRQEEETSDPHHEQ
ncbi:MAG: cation-translocating P-type ATPase [Lentisphaeria bacterium]|nr:cation-translocating P-type ATPase [Lentisphaeria bacterium]